MSGSTLPRDRAVTAGHHLRAILLLPFVNTIVIPAAMLAIADGNAALGRPLNGAEIASAAVACSLLLAGLALVQHCIRRFARFGGGTLAPWDPPRALVVEGAYRYSRNPMKAGLFAILLGEALLWRSWSLLAWLLVFATVNVVYIRLHEEPQLQRRFGTPYRDYCRRVPRWYPSLTHFFAPKNRA